MPVDKSALETHNNQPTPTPDQAGATPSGYRGDIPATGGPGKTAVQSSTPENSAGHLNPSAPEDSNITPGSSTEK